MNEKLTDYFKHRIEMDKDRPYLPFRRKPCADCAVMEGFYSEFSEALKLEQKAVQKEISSKWFCHTNPDEACRGNSNFLGITK